MAILKEGNKSNSIYNGLTPQEARELYEGLYSDYSKQVRQQKGEEVAQATRESMGKFAKDYMYPAAKMAASFTPAGVAIGLMDAKHAYDQGKTGTAIALAGLEALPYGLKYGVKGAKAAKGILKSTKPNINFMMKSQVNSVDDLLSLPESKIKEFTGLEKDFWLRQKEKLVPEKLHKFLGQRLGRGQNIHKLPDITDSNALASVERGRDTQEQWLNSDEWLRRRMTATGEPEGKAKIARSMMLQKLKDTNVSVKDLSKSDDINFQGFATQGDVPSITVGHDSVYPQLTEGLANHEFVHASTTWSPNFSFKGIPFKKIPYNSTNPQVMRTVDYLNQEPEMQARGVRALQYLKNKGLWESGDVSDEAIEVLKSTYRQQPNDVANLTSNFNKSDLKGFLNKVYGISAIGSSIKAIQND